MKQWLQQFFLTLAGFLLIFLLGIFLTDKILHRNVFAEVQSFIAPCSQPVQYNFGSFDKRFGISEDEFHAAVAEAEKIWEQPAQKDLFSYDPSGPVTINLVYDYRQESTEKLKTLGIEINDDKASYTSLKQKYADLEVSYNTKKAVYDRALAAYDKRRKAFETQVSYWNTHGGAPKPEFEKLSAEQEALKSQAAQLDVQRKALNDIVDQINALVVPLNKLVSELSLKAETYNGIGKSVGTAFDEGIYKSDIHGQEITIYQFADHAKLIKVLAHELGHALGLPHNDNPVAIMYRLNEGGNEQLAPEDLAALKARCNIK